MRRTASILVPVIALLALACSGAQYETVTHPPRIDLTQHETIGVIEFSSPDNRELAAMATARFMEQARADQGTVRMMTLRYDGPRPDAARLRELAEKNGLKTIVVGDLHVSKVRPSVSVSDTLSSANVSGAIEATLSVEMFETSTGASLWNASGRTQETIGNVNVDSLKHIDFAAGSKKTAYDDMVNTLVSQVTRDMHASWERRRVR